MQFFSQWRRLSLFINLPLGLGVISIYSQEEILQAGEIGNTRRKSLHIIVDSNHYPGLGILLTQMIWRHIKTKDKSCRLLNNNLDFNPP
jgi:mannitol-specific phosphotransferase system IIBC component